MGISGMNSPLEWVIEKALMSGYLTIEAEVAIRQLTRQGCNLAQIEALAQLQLAINSGSVKRLSQQQDEASYWP